MSVKKVIIIHGWEGSPQADWFPWLKKELKAKGFVVEVPAMPDTMHPTLESWLVHLKKVTGEPNENTYFVGHSLGVITILRYLESLEDKKVGGIVLVAGFSEQIGYDLFEVFDLALEKIIEQLRKVENKRHEK